jgi:hypothetical protein
MIVPPGILLNLAFAKSGVQTAGGALHCQLTNIYTVEMNWHNNMPRM